MTEDPNNVANASQAWRFAAEKMGFRVIAPFDLEYGQRTYRCIAFLPDFGGARGMIVAPLTLPNFNLDSEIMKIAEERGLYCSFVSPRGWERFDEAGYKDALEDWGYFGPRLTRPAWFSGYDHSKDP